MSQVVESPAKTMTFSEYRFYEGEPDVLYELLRGRLIPIATPTSLHTRICDYIAYILDRYFASQNISLVATSVTGERTEVDTSRIPDVVICSEALWSQMLRPRCCKYT